MKGEINVSDGMVILHSIHFNKLFMDKKVIKHDKAGNQGKICLPRDLIGKLVVVIVPSNQTPIVKSKNSSGVKPSVS